MLGRLPPDTADVGDDSEGETGRPTWLPGNVGGAWRIGGTVASAERIRRICSAYGGVHPTQIVDMLPRRIQMMLDWIPRGAAAGDAGLRRLMGQGEPQRSQAALNELVPRLRRIRLLLQ